MALFFDAAWFDAQLSARHLTRGAIGTMLGLDEAGVAELWKDQRELKAGDVALIAALLNLPPDEIASRAGISTPVPRTMNSVEQRLAAMEAKLDRIIEMLKAR